MQEMCKIDWTLVLEYLKVLIWPSVIVTLLIFNRKILNDLFHRIVYKSNKLGIGLFSVDFTKEELETIIAKSKDKTEIVKNVNEHLNYQAINKAVDLAVVFSSSNKQERDRITIKIKELVRNIDVSYIQSQSELDKFEYKLVFLVSILQKIENDKDFKALDSKSIKEFVIESLKDSNSFIRFKASQIFYLSEKLSKENIELIKSTLKKETNLAVQRMLKYAVIFYEETYK